MPAHAGAANDVRNDESDETDEARGGHGRRGNERRARVDAAGCTLGIETEGRRRVVAQREHVDSPGPGEEGAATDRSGSQSRPGEAGGADHPEPGTLVGPARVATGSGVLALGEVQPEGKAAMAASAWAAGFRGERLGA